MTRTNIFATKKEIKKLVELAKTAQTMPVLSMSCADGLAGRDFATLAWKAFYVELNEVAKKHNVPPTMGEYGFDGSNGEFLLA